jgi:hypothetical protein
MKHPFRIAAALLLAAACGDSPTGEKPKPELPDIAVGATVEDRVLQGTVDEFDLVAPSSEFRILLRVTTGSAADTLVAELVGEAGGSAGGVTSVGTDTELTSQASPWLAPTPGVPWRIRVRGLSPAHGGSYTLRLFPRSSGPESRPAAIALNQAVEGEALDVAGDVDEFTLEGTAGDEWIVFAQNSLQPAGQLNVSVIDRASGESAGGVTAPQPSPAVEQYSSGRLRLTKTGTYAVRVTGGDSFNPDARGAYKLRIDRVNYAPESGSATLAPGAVAGDAINSVGDVDEFTFTAAEGQEMNLLVQLQQGMADGLRVELLRGGQPVTEALLATEPAASLNERGTGRIALPVAGTYTVRVSGPAYGIPTAATGTYRFELYPVDRRPEAPGSITLDGAVLSNTIDRPGDVDEFPLAGTAGQLVVIHGSGAAPGVASLQAEVVNAAGEVVAAVGLNGAATNYGRRVQLPATGTYTLRVAAPFYTFLGTGPYTVGAYTVSPAPEHVPATLAIGQTVTAERIDRPGDLDVFRFPAQAGREVAVFLGAAPEVGGLMGSVRGVGEPGLWAFMFGGGPSLDGASTGRMKLEYPEYEVVVDPQLTSGFTGGAMQGSYGLRIHEVDRRPEGRPAAYVLGDTVKTEPIYPSVDVDEYTFTLAATTTLHIVWQGPTATNGGFGGIGNLVNLDTSESVWSSMLSTRQITLPAGRYHLGLYVPAAQAPAFNNPVSARLTYRFAFIPQ